MYIGRLQLRGFKSFGGSHDLPLSPGFTAIVGPNGSGKSNLLDALRWALGDSHAAKLRIARQSDLLFQGSISLNAARDAEVSIQLRDETRLCAVKRKLAGDGATQVFVDGARKTLSELDEVKRFWRLEGDRFAFIGQGEVAEVIQQRPSARRLQLETLFGIDLYRKRRMEAADRLRLAQEEYDRLRHFAAELSARREAIAPEVERGLQARALLDALADDRKLLYWLRRRRLLAVANELKAQAQALVSQRERRLFWKGAWARACSFADGKIAQVLQIKENQARQLESCRASIEELRRKGFTHGSSFAAHKKRALQLASELASLGERFEKLRREREEVGAKKKGLQSSLTEKKKRLDEAQGQWEELLARQEEFRLARERANQEWGGLESESERIRGRLGFLGKRVVELRTQKTDQEQGGENLETLFEEAEKALEKALADQESLVFIHQDLYARCQQLSADLQRARRESSQLASRLADATDAVQGEVYPRAVQHLLSAVKLGRFKASPRAVIDAFSCDEKIAGALEAYLGGRQFWLLVRDMDEAGRCIEQLKSSAAGRATFLPLERARPRQPDERFPLPPKGIVGWASRLIAPEPEWKAGLDHLMGDLLLVEDYRTAQDLVRNGFRSPVATLEGDVFQPGGTVSGGRSADRGRALELKSQLAKLEVSSREARVRVDHLAQELATSEEAEAESSAQKESGAAKVKEADARLVEANRRIESRELDRERVQEELKMTLDSLKEQGAAFLEVQRRLEHFVAASGDEMSVPEDQALATKMEKLKSDLALDEERFRSLFVLEERMSTETRALEQQRGALEEELAELDRERLADRGALSQIGKKHLEVFTRRGILLREIEEFTGRSGFLERSRRRLDAHARAAETALREVDIAHASATTKAEDLEREQAELVSTWEDQYPYPGDGAFCEADTGELRRAIKERERELKALGDVDMGVLSEDRSLQDRLAFLGDQLDDVRAGQAELQRLINDSDAQAGKIFAAALEEIDRRFNDLFQRLFGGGEAHLELVEGDSLWDSGVDVVARPPGKHPQSINQLSGGEQSLSAISLLFASMEVADCPLAVLDEVDAALDEVNLRRFAEVAKEYASARQILAMTHRRVTMERADVLYGVTLSEPGLSQVIGVRLEDWS